MANTPVNPGSPGRPSSINPMQVSAVLTGMADGLFFKHATENAGVSRMTAANWKNKGQNALDAARDTYPEVDATLTDWLLVFPDNFSAKNPMWDAPHPMEIDKSDWLFVLFFVLSKKAEARAIAKSIKNITKAGRDGNWQASAWYLERTQQADFGRQQKIQHTGADGGPIESVVAASADELQERLRKFRERKAQG